MREPVFTQIMQIGFVVRDLDATIQQYVDEYGIGPWERHDELTSDNAKDLWSTVDVLLVNGVEAERLSGMPVAGVPGAVKASEAFQQRFAIPSVIVTLGGQGVVALDDRGVRHLPAWPVSVVETIGAGDAFAGVLASELARGRQLDEALPLANAAGALAVTRPGAHDALPTAAQIRAFLEERQRTESDVDGC